MVFLRMARTYFNTTSILVFKRKVTLQDTFNLSMYKSVLGEKQYSLKQNLSFKASKRDFGKAGIKDGNTL